MESKNKRVRLGSASLFLLLFLPLCCSDSRKPISGELPDVSFRNLQDHEITLNSYRGNLILLVFWATWCQPCLIEIPSLISLHSQYKNRKFQVVSVLTDNPPLDDIRQLANEFGINYDILKATVKQTQMFGGIRAIPTSFLISTEGKLLEKMEGLIPEHELESKIRRFLVPKS